MVHFIGAGPGAEYLITVRGAKLLGEADVIIYAGSLVNPALLSYKKESCAVYDSASMTLEQVIEQENLSYDYETLSDMIEPGAVNSTEVFEIQVTSADPEEAERIANCIAELLPGRISEIVEGSSVKIVDYAIVPSQKSSPSISRYTLLGLLLGAVVSCGVIVLMELFDEQSRDEDYVRQTFDLPLLAAVPDLTGQGAGHSYYKTTSGKEAQS